MWYWWCYGVGTISETSGSSSGPLFSDGVGTLGCTSSDGSSAGGVTSLLPESASSDDSSSDFAGS